ncbi:MAG TPA: cupredoxin domain-containing protein [Candidatus Paceibacterota bacterium]
MKNSNGMKATIISIIFAVTLIGGVVALGKYGQSPSGGVGSANNVSIVDGKQIIEIDARGGYWPAKSQAKAGIPTVLRFKTNGTFDCSAFVRIPSMSLSKILPQTGSTDIDLGSAKAGILQGMCGMGMYPFEINFQS